MDKFVFSSGKFQMRNLCYKKYRKGEEFQGARNMFNRFQLFVGNLLLIFLYGRKITQSNPFNAMEKSQASFNPLKTKLKKTINNKSIRKKTPKRKTIFYLLYQHNYFDYWSHLLRDYSKMCKLVLVFPTKQATY